MKIRLKPVIRFGATSSRLGDGVLGGPQHRCWYRFPSLGKIMVDQVFGLSTGRLRFPLGLSPTDKR